MNNSLVQNQSPFNAQTFDDQIDLEYWLSVKNKLKSASPHNEPLPELRKLYQLLVNLNTLENPDQYLGLHKTKVLFFDTFLPIAKNIMRSKIKYSNEMEELIHNCLQQMILLWLKKLSEGHLGVFKMAEVILNPMQPYYTHRSSIQQDSVASSELHDDPNDKPQKQGKSSFFEDFLAKTNLNITKIFDIIYQIVSNQKHLSSMTTIIPVCWIANNLSHVLPKSSAIEYTSKIREALCETIIKNPNQYKDSFGPLFIKRSHEAFARLFKISFSCPEERHYAFLNFKLQIARLCIDDSNSETNKSIGIRIIGNIMTDVENPSSEKFKDRSRILCNEFFRDILERTFDRISFSKLILNANPGVFYYAFKQNLLKPEDLKTLWIALKHTQTQNNIYSVIEKLFKQDQSPVLLDNLLSVNFSNIPFGIDVSDVELLFKIGSSCFRRELMLRKTRDFFWNFLVNSDKQTDSELTKLVFTKYEILMKLDLPAGHYYFSTANIMKDCIHNIEKDNTKFVFFRIITLMAFVYDTDRETLREKRVLEMFIQHLRSFKALNKPQLGDKPEPYYSTQISERLLCLEGLLNRRIPEKHYLTYEALSELWEIFVDQALVPAERDLFFKTLKRIAKSEIGLGMSPVDLMKFYKEKILNKDSMKYLQKSKEGVACFKSFVIAVNHDLKKMWRVKPRPGVNVKAGFLVKVVPEEVEGYEEMWNFIMSCEDRKAASKAIKFLVKIYFNLEDQFETDLANIRERFIVRCFEYLKSPVSGSSNCHMKCLELINKMMDETGKNGIQELDSHAKIISNDVLELSLDLTDFGQPITKLSISSSSTNIELLKQIAKKLGVDWETIEVSRYPYSPQKIPYTENGKTLSDLGLRQQERLNVLKRAPLANLDLFCNSDTFHPRVKKVFSKCFEEHSENGKMSIEQCAIFLNPQYRFFNWNIANNSGVKNIFLKYDSDGDGYLTLDDFFKYQTNYCKHGIQEVWNIVRRYNKRHDLRDESDLARINNDKRSLVSSLIQSNSKYYEILFSLLNQEEEVASEAWKLLNRLPTYAQLFEDIVMLRGVRGIEDPTKRDWTSLLSLNSKYKLLYVLNIAEYLMNYDESSKQIALTEDPKLIEYQRTWKQDFIRYGGLDYLSDVFSLFKPAESTVLTQECKRVFVFANAIGSKLHENEQSDKEIQGRILKFIEVLSQFESEYKIVEQTVAANFMRRTIRKLKSRRAKINETCI